ncbi:MAG: AAA family ATPase [Planctomycetota bacterium]
MALLGRLSAVLDAFAAFDEAKFREQLVDMDKAREALTTATKEGLASFPIPGFQSETWKAFVEAAQAYVAAEMPGDYPQEGEPCAYCLQPLEEAAVELLRKYREFLLGSHQAALSTATRAVSASASGLEELDLESISNEMRVKVENAEDAHRTIRDGLALLPHLEKVVGAVKKRSDPEEVPRQRVAELKVAVTERSSGLESTEKDLGEAVTKRKELLADAEKELRELSDRMVLAELLPGVREHVENSKWASRATTLGRTMTGILKSLTEEAKAASKRLIYQDFEATFGDECKALKAPSVNLNFAGEGGAPARTKSLAPQVGLRAILSEGEQKVIALADFLAEATLRRSASPMVFDDPVTSLDYRRMRYVAERLVDLSKGRQVIVFTHNVWFTMLLLEHFDKNKSACSYFDITEAGEKRGKVQLGGSPKLDTWDDRRKRVNRLIERAKVESDAEMQTMFVEKGYEALRGACEIVVEQKVLKSVVQSYRPNVMVGNLRDINIQSLAETRDGVCDIFDDCCRYLDSHKQPLETLNVRPTLAGLEADWKKLQELRREH